MITNVSFATAEASLDNLCDEVIEHQRITVIHRRGKPNVALIPAHELRSWLATLHLLKSPKNAARLLTAFHRALSRGSQM